MKSILSVFLLSLGLVTGASAQEVYSSSGKSLKAIEKKKEKEEKRFANRLVYGGGFGLGIGTVTNISVSPIVGYAVTKNFFAGIGLGYQYIRVKDYWAVQDLSTGEAVYKPFTSNVYSPSVWARYIVYRNFFVHAEYEHNFMTYRKYFNNTSAPPPSIDKIDVKYNAPSLLLGAGIRMPVSDKVSFVLMALYDVIQDTYSPYRGTIAFRFGINAGF